MGFDSLAAPAVIKLAEGHLVRLVTQEISAWRLQTDVYFPLACRLRTSKRKANKHAMAVRTQINAPRELLKAKLPFPQAARTSSKSCLRSGSGSMESSATGIDPRMRRGRFGVRPLSSGRRRASRSTSPSPAKNCGSSVNGNRDVSPCILSSIIALTSLQTPKA